MEIIGYTIAIGGLIVMSALTGIYTANRTGNPVAGIVGGLGFALVFGIVLWRALAPTRAGRS